MAREMARANPFLTYLETHPGADSEALKQLFRILAKRTHPDTAGSEDREFILLQESYQEALAHVKSARRIV